MTKFVWYLHNAIAAYESMVEPQVPIARFVEDFMGSNAEIVTRCKDCIFAVAQDDGSLHCTSCTSRPKLVKPENYCCWAGARRYE